MTRTPETVWKHLLDGNHRFVEGHSAHPNQDPSRREKLTAGSTLVTAEMVTALEHHIDALKERFAMPTDFVIPGANRVSAALELARTIVRRAERDSLDVAVDGSHLRRTAR